jgi:hypothetical protein
VKTGDERSRKIVEMYDVQKLRFKDIARQFELSPTRVQVLYHDEKARIEEEGKRLDRLEMSATFKAQSDARARLLAAINRVAPQEMAPEQWEGVVEFLEGVRSGRLTKWNVRRSMRPAART